MKAPSLVSDEVRRLSDDELKGMIVQRTNGEMERKSAHAQLKKRLNQEQVGELVGYLRRMRSR
jgi:hypothetical protein